MTDILSERPARTDGHDRPGGRDVQRLVGPHPTTITIPQRSVRNGPLTRRRQRRTALILGGVEAAGLGLSLIGKSKSSTAAGLGIMMPGAGYLYAKKPLRAGISAGSAALGLVLWIGNGNHVATPAAWFGSAAMAARKVRGTKKPLALAQVAVPAAAGIAAVVMGKRTREDLKKQQDIAAKTNQYLGAFTPPLRDADRPDPFVADELSLDELKLARHLLQIALQDDDDWSNYQIIEQFQPTAIRYQLNGLGWALSLLQYARMPAFHGYVSEAQRRLISKYQQRKVWSYWWLENLWGNFELNADPVRKQNVMLSGWYGLQIATYQSASGDVRYTDPDCIRFKWNRDTQYRYSFSTICDAMARDLAKSEWSMIVCEPNWLYTICNTTAGNAFRVHDRMLGTSYWDDIRNGFTRTVDEELHRVDGTAQMFKSTRIGYGNGKSPAPSVELRPLIPNLADRGWALMRAGVWKTDDSGEPVGTIFKDMPNGFDYGNAGRSKVVQYGSVIEAAREAGDEDRARAAWNELIATTPPDRTATALSFPDASLMAHAAVGRGAFTRKGAWLDLIERGLRPEWVTGPILDDVPFNEAMVARAETDGTNLDVVVYPVDNITSTTVRIARLNPGADYVVDTNGRSHTVNADSAGIASTQITLEGRTAITVRPANGTGANSR
jgi:hypothetical protein